ncbi:MAG TPA: flagellar export chaperone FliS [Caldimonas sp.]|nr:flagellar export chaperone FliS [Caldimonas sp.]
MFSNTFQPGQRPTVLGLYRNVGAASGVEGASPHKLVCMLYEAVCGEIAAARGALARRDVAEKGRAIGKAVRLIEEGLLAPLDLEAGGAIAANLRDLYQYMVYRLTMGNLHSDDAALADCAGLARTLSDTWTTIAPQVDAPARAAA